MYRIIETANPSNSNRIVKDSKNDYSDDILESIEKKYGSTKNQNGTQPDILYYWLDGNLRVDYYKDDKKVIVMYSDMIQEREILIELENQDKNKQLLQDSLKNSLKNEELKIVEKLKAKAKRDWPDDYTTQEYWINEQIEAYHQMLLIPNDDKIKKKAQRDWPLDFSTQLYWYNEQIEAKERIK